MSMQQESFLNGLSTAIVCWTVVGLGFKTAKFLRKGLSNRGPTTLEEGDGTRGIEGESIYKQIDDFISNKDDRNAASGSLKLGEKDVDEPVTRARDNWRKTIIMSFGLTVLASVLYWKQALHQDTDEDADKEQGAIRMALAWSIMGVYTLCKVSSSTSSEGRIFGQRTTLVNVQTVIFMFASSVYELYRLIDVLVSGFEQENGRFTNAMGFSILRFLAVVVNALLVGLTYNKVRIEKVESPLVQQQDGGEATKRMGGNVYTSATKLVETPEYSASFISRLYFAWLNNVVKEAGRIKLDYIDLFKFQGKDLPGSNWEEYAATKKRYRNSSLLIKSILYLRWEFIRQFSIGFMLTIVKFSGPFFLNKILTYLEDKNNEGGVESNRSVIYGYCVGMLIFTTIQYLLEGQSLWIGRRLSIKLKNALSCEIADKALNSIDSTSDIGPTEKDEKQKNDDGDAEENSRRKILNLVSTDLSRVTEVAAYLDFLVMLPIQAFVGIAYLYMLLGPASLCGVLIMICYYPFTKMIFNYMVDLETKLNLVSDKRMVAIGEMIGGMRAVKLFGWEDKFVDKITNLRSKQLEYLWKFLKMWVVVGVGSSILPMLVLYGSFVIYAVVLKNEMTSSVAFTSLAVFSILKTVFDMYPGFLTWSLGGLVSLRRIEGFIGNESYNLPDMKRKHTSESSDSSKDAATRNEYDFGFIDATLSWDYSRSQKKDKADENTPLLTPAATPSSSTTVSLSANDENDHGSTGSDGDKKSNFKLRNLNIKFPKNKLTIIAGKIGSGKTSILRALIGEMKLVDGYIKYPTATTSTVMATHPGLGMNAMIGYVPQESWLRNATVRDNILFGSEYDVERYEQVLKMTALKADFRQLVNGDQSQVGERGITLSGGQKQRISLARALYSQAQYLLLDDVLSAVDSQTAHHIVHSCFDPSSRNKIMEGRTVVLVTHMIDLVVNYAGWVVVMKEGKIVEQGSDTSKFTYLSSISFENNQPAKSKRKGKSKKSKGTAAKRRESDKNEPSTLQKADQMTEDQYNKQRLEQKLLAASQPSSHGLAGTDGPVFVGNEEDGEEEGEGEEEREYGSLKLNVWKTYLTSLGGSNFWITVVVLAIASRLMYIFQNYWIRIWLQQPQSGDNDKNIRTALYYLQVYLLTGLIFIALQQLSNYVLFKGGLRSSRDVHLRLIRSVANAIPSFFDVTPVGRILNRFSRDTMRLDERTVENFSYMLVNVISSFTVLAVIVSVVPMFVVVAALIAVFFVKSSIKYLTATREVKRLDSNTISPLISIFVELGGSGSSVIRCFNKSHDYILEVARRVDTNNRSYYLEWALNRWIGVTTDSIGSLVGFFSALLIVLAVDFAEGGIDAGLAGFTLSYALTFSSHVMWIVRDYGELELSMNCMERISQYFEDRLPQQIQILSATPPQLNTIDDTSAWPSTGELVVKNLCVKYDSSKTLALKNISFTLPAGKTLAVVGRTGSGKSTLTLALLRLVESMQGSQILIDGVDIASVSLSQLRQSITIIPQDPLLFSGSLRHNLDLFDEYTNEYILNAIEQTNLFHGTNIDSLDFMIQEKGSNLSTGQKQLVSLTRALLRKSKIIILDEATASIDYHTERSLISAIKSLNSVHGCSIITIAHRLNTVIDYDYTMVLDKGTLSSFVLNKTSGGTTE